MLSELASHDGVAVKAFLTLSTRAHRKGELESKYKELIALALAVFKGCDHCIAYHLKQAMSSGASIGEIKETLIVVLTMGGGSTSSSIVSTLKMLQDLKD